MKKLLLKKDRDKSLRQRHPWVFSGAIDSLPEAETGEIVEVRNADNQWLGYGFYDAQAQIVCKVFEFESIEPVFDLEYWRKKIARAAALRQVLITSLATDCYRLVNAEGDLFPGLIVDIYKDTAVIQFTIPGTFRLRKEIEQIILEHKAANIFLQNFDKTSSWSTREHFGDLTVKENNLKFMIDPERGQKTGYFLDQRDNRALLKNYSRGKKVLNAFAYTGGFSVYALAGDADLVHSVDISGEALLLCDQHTDINFGKSAPHKSFQADCFDFLRNLKEQYDIIVLDPPAFAKHKSAVDKAARGYKDINMHAAKHLNQEGLLFTFSCSQHISADLFRKIVFGAILDAGREASVLHELHQPFDHPVSIYHPEGNYLKGLVLRVK